MYVPHSLFLSTAVQRVEDVPRLRVLRTPRLIPHIPCLGRYRSLDCVQRRSITPEGKRHRDSSTGEITAIESNDIRLRLKILRLLPRRH